MSNKAKVARYNLIMPEKLFEELKKLADEENTSLVDIIRRAIRLGLFVDKVQKDPDAALILRKNGVERQVIIL